MSVPLKLHVFVIPMALMAILPLSGCTRVPPPPPGGTYRSESGGGRFEQAVQIAGEPGKYIAQFALQQIDRPPHDPNSIYIAAGEDGVVISHDDGQNWQVVTTPLAFATDVIVLENGALVAAGTDGIGQGFVVRSLDAGKSWQSVFTVPIPKEEKGITIVGGDQVLPSIVLTLARDPFNADRIYAGSSLGTIFVGEQSAKVWRTLYTIQPTTPSPVANRQQRSVKILIASPHVAGELLVITELGDLLRIKGTSQEEIEVPQYISTPAPPLAGSGKQKVLDAAFIEGFPDALIVGVENGAVVTRDGGESWLELSVPAESNERFNSVVVRVSPTNVNRIFVAINSVIYRSEDGGSTWNTFALGLPTFTILDVSINPSNAAKMLLVARQLT